MTITNALLTQILMSDFSLCIWFCKEWKWWKNLRRHIQITVNSSRRRLLWCVKCGTSKTSPLLTFLSCKSRINHRVQSLPYGITWIIRLWAHRALYPNVVHGVLTVGRYGETGFTLLGFLFKGTHAQLGLTRICFQCICLLSGCVHGRVCVCAPAGARMWTLKEWFRHGSRRC